MRGGARPGAGRPRGAPNKRTRKLTEATAEAVAIAAKQGITPLQHMMNVLHDPDATPTRKDAAAANAAPYVHCKLSATAVVDVLRPDPNYTPPSFTIVCVPNGGQYDPKTGKISYADGTVADPPPFTPYTPTPELTALPAPAELVEPLLVHELDEADDKVEVLNAWRRRSGGDDGAA
jgi:hypothetical protein